jgi:SOS response regulatory protein OraA/RecX
VPTVTALRERRLGRVDVELDDGPWRTLPVEVVARAGLGVGQVLDRAALRLVRRELRRAEALGIATRALRARDLSRRELSERLVRRVEPATADETVATLARVGLVDDRRAAEHRAAALSGRGYGDAAIRHDLEQRGLGGEDVKAALATLGPETERAAAIVRRRGPGPRTARYLAGRGFGDDSCEAALGDRFATDP